MRRLAALLLALAAFGQDAEEPAPTRLDEANREAARRVVRTVADRGASLRARLRGLRKDDVLVVGGLFDFVQEVLVAFRLEHTVLTPAELEHHPLDHPERKVILLNCHLMDRDFPETRAPAARASDAEARRRLAEVLEEAGLEGDDAPGKAIRERFGEVAHFAGSDYSAKGLARLGQAVRDGTWAVSTDWAVLVWEKALPGTLRWTGHTTFEERIEVRPALAGRRHALLEGCFGTPAKARWWIETESYLFAVRGRYTRLVESRQLAARYRGNRDVVVLLEPGKGRVLHALSHGYLQKGRADDVSVMQRLLLNFLIEKSIANHERDRAERERDAGR